MRGKIKKIIIMKMTKDIDGKKYLDWEFLVNWTKKGESNLGNRLVWLRWQEI